MGEQAEECSASNFWWGPHKTTGDMGAVSGGCWPLPRHPSREAKGTRNKWGPITHTTQNLTPKGAGDGLTIDRRIRINSG